MAEFAPLVIGSTGQQQKLTTADALNANTILPQSGTALAIGDAADTITIAGTLNVAVETVSSTLTTTGDTDIGDDAADTLTIVASIDSDLRFLAGTTPAISPQTPGGTTGTAGDTLAVTAGIGGLGLVAAGPTAAGVGGALSSAGASGGAGTGTDTAATLASDAGVGGASSLLGGTGGAGSTTGTVDNADGGAGGGIIILGGDGGVAGSGAGAPTGGAGGNVSIDAGAGTGAEASGNVSIGTNNATIITVGAVANPTTLFASRVDAATAGVALATTTGGTADGSSAIGVDTAGFANSAGNDVHQVLSDYDTAITAAGGASTLQTSYDSGPDIIQDATGGTTISRVNGGGSADTHVLRLSDTESTGVNTFEINKSPTSPSAGNALDITLGVNVNGSAIAISSPGGKTVAYTADAIKFTTTLALVGVLAPTDSVGPMLSLTGGAGGAASAATGGAGGAANLSGAVGGVGSGAFVGGAGGASSVKGGTGGAGTASALSGAGGSLTVTAGSAGATGGAGQGLGGNIDINPGAGGTAGVLSLGVTAGSASAINSGNSTDVPAWTHKGGLIVQQTAAATAFSISAISGAVFEVPIGGAVNVTPTSGANLTMTLLGLGGLNLTGEQGALGMISAAPAATTGGSVQLSTSVKGAAGVAGDVIVGSFSNFGQGTTGGVSISTGTSAPLSLGVAELDIDSAGVLGLTSAGAMTIVAGATSAWGTTVGSLTLTSVAELTFNDVGGSAIELSQAADRTLDQTAAGEVLNGSTSVIGSLNRLARAIDTGGAISVEIAIENAAVIAAGDTVAASATAGRCVRMNANANTAGNFLGIAEAGGTGDAGGTVLARVIVAGQVVDSGATFTQGALFAPDGTGRPTNTAPVSVGDLVFRVGFAYSATEYVLQAGEGVVL